MKEWIFKDTDLNYTDLIQISCRAFLSLYTYMHGCVCTHVWKEEEIYFLDKTQYFPS